MNLAMASLAMPVIGALVMQLGKRIVLNINQWYLRYQNMRGN